MQIFPFQDFGYILPLLSGLQCLFFFFKELSDECFLAVLGLRCCAQAFSSRGKQGLLLVVMCGLLTEVACLVAGRVLGAQASVVAACGLSSSGTQVQLPRVL